MENKVYIISRHQQQVKVHLEKMFKRKVKHQCGECEWWWLMPGQAGHRVVRGQCTKHTKTTFQSLYCPDWERKKS